MKKWAIGITSISLALYGIVSLTSSTSEEIPTKSHSTYKKVLGAQSIQPVAVKALMYESDKKLKMKVATTSKLRKEYLAYFDKGPKELSANLDKMEKKHYELLSEMRKSGVTIDPVTLLKPRFALVLSYHLNLHVSELTAADLDTLKLSNKEWYLIKTFSESNDFKIMLQRNTLTTSFVQLDNLASIY